MEPNRVFYVPTLLTLLLDCDRMLLPSRLVRIYKTIWVRPIPLKCSFLTLRVLKDRLPFDKKINRLGVALASSCSCCNIPQTETAHHLFRHSRWVVDL